MIRTAAATPSVSASAGRNSAMARAKPVASTVHVSGTKGATAPVPFRAPVAKAAPSSTAATPETVAPAPQAVVAAVATAAVAKAEAAAAVAKAEAAAAVAAAEAAAAVATAEAAASAASAASAATAAGATGSDDANPVPFCDTPPTKEDDGEGDGVTTKESGSGEKAGVPHTIFYTVAGMPRPGGSGSGVDRRGPREGTVTAYTGWTLRDLKVKSDFPFCSRD